MIGLPTCAKNRPNAILLVLYEAGKISFAIRGRKLIIKKEKMAGAEVFVDNLVGTWKRCLQWRHFGGAFQYLRSSNTVIVVSADF